MFIKEPVFGFLLFKVKEIANSNYFRKVKQIINDNFSIQTQAYIQ